MTELKCPECGAVFQVDDADYAAILSQVKNKEFDAEVDRRINELHERQKAEQELAAAKAQQTFQSQLSDKEKALSAKDAEIERLKNQLQGAETQKKSELAVALAAKDQEIARLNSTISQSENNLKIAVLEEKQRAQQAVQQKDAEIIKLKADVELEKKEAQNHEAVLIKQHAEAIQAKQAEVDYYKDLKTKLSTKLVGETLEQHCRIEYEQYIRPHMPNAYFDKDNEAVEGTKGDFIFRDSEDGVEYISIMFEMKNESDTTSTKHKNDDFLKKLDEDRRKKNCEFAVLVSLLEPDNDLYNNGIVNKSYMYDQMYVIRPQFFVSFINLMVQASKKSLDYKKQLIEAQQKEIDITNFEDKIELFKTSFLNHYRLANNQYKKAVDDIDSTIEVLKGIKESLRLWETHLKHAQKDTEDLTIRRLTLKNPTMKAKFAEARAAAGKQSTDDNNLKEI